MFQYFNCASKLLESIRRPPSRTFKAIAKFLFKKFFLILIFFEFHVFFSNFSGGSKN